MIFGEHPLKDAWRRVIWGPGRAALEGLPPGWEQRIARARGRAAALAMVERRARIRDNVARAFPEAPAAVLDRVARDAFATHFAYQYLCFSFGKCTAETWRRYLSWRGLERLQAAQAAGRGVVLAHPHMGPAQLPLHVLGLLGWPMHQVGGGRITLVSLSPTGVWAAETRRSLEARMPVEVHDGKRFLRPLLRALEVGGVVMSACDATGGGEELGRRAPAVVLGQPMPVPIGPVWLALRSGAPLLTVHCHRNPEPGPLYVAEIGPEIAFPRDAGREAAVTEGTRAIAGWLDETLRAWPGEWHFWDGFSPGGLLPT